MLDVPLIGGITYQVNLTVYSGSNNGSTEVRYATSTGTVINKEACGIRVKQINSFDPLASNINSKFYTYASLNSLSQTSGVGDLSPVMSTTSSSGAACYRNDREIINDRVMVRCSDGQYSPIQVSSSSVFLNLYIWWFCYCLPPCNRKR